MCLCARVCVSVCVRERRMGKREGVCVCMCSKEDIKENELKIKKKYSENFVKVQFRENRKKQENE